VNTLFITGSGTGVGKTLVTQLLIADFRRRARPIRALKPIATGFDHATAATSDSGMLLAALGVAVDTPQLDRVSPWRFHAPLSPDMAAAREGRTIPFAEVVRHCEPHAEAFTLIEGVGGVMVPLDDRHTVVDWIAAVGCPAVLVTGSYLGVISHTLSALDVLSTRNIAVRGIVVSESIEQPTTLAETAATIAKHAPETPVIQLPRLAAGTTPPELLRRLDIGA